MNKIKIKINKKLKKKETKVVQGRVNGKRVSLTKIGKI
jgi:hypothetical protein